MTPSARKKKTATLQNHGDKTGKTWKNNTQQIQFAPRKRPTSLVTPPQPRPSSFPFWGTSRLSPGRLGPRVHRLFHRPVKTEEWELGLAGEDAIPGKIFHGSAVRKCSWAVGLGVIVANRDGSASCLWSFQVSNTGEKLPFGLPDGQK